ncbi:4-sulfomuconolactone hydrolase [Nymphaea thermarum]|nr:4-sulfomuconolactone hydrolase [Nymphaea thermarum]
MAASSSVSASAPSSSNIIDSHLHIWASPQEAAGEFPYSPGHEPTLQGDLNFLLKCMEDAGVDGALIVQPINHMFDHSLVTSALRRHPTKFVGCCLANPANDGAGIRQLEHLVIEEGYRAVRFNPYLWPSNQKMTNEIGKSLFRKAGELGVPVGIMCFKGLHLHLSEIEELCTEFPSTTVIIDHMGFCKPPINEAERHIFAGLLRLSKFPRVYIKYSALFRISRSSFPYEDTAPLLSQVITSYGINRIMWGRQVTFNSLAVYFAQTLIFRSLSYCSDFPFVVAECGYKEAKESVLHISKLLSLTSTDMEWLMGKTAQTLFKNAWQS